MSEKTLRVEKIAETAEKLRRRISERLPESGLSKVAHELVCRADDARVRVPLTGRPIYSLRVAVAILIAAIIALVASLVLSGLDNIDQFSRASLAELMVVVETGTNEVILIGLAIIFLISVETRLKRARSLRAIHELRSLAHVIDMRQLTKDPGYFRNPSEATASSPMRGLSLPKMMRYLEYCSELLSITSKIAALYAQTMNDRVVLAAVADVEVLVTGLCQKIWQKLDIAGEICE